MESPETIKAIIKVLIANKENDTRRRLSGLVILFNLAFDAQSKIDLLEGKLTCSIDISIFP